MSGICLTCDFFDPDAADFDEPDKGCCRRYPPQAHYDAEADEAVTVWPTVDMADRCGEWRQA